MSLTGLWILYRLVRPVNRLEAGLIIALGAILALMLVPSPLADFYALRLPPPRTTALVLALLAATIGVLQLALRLLPDHHERTEPSEAESGA